MANEELKQRAIVWAQAKSFHLGNEAGTAQRQGRPALAQQFIDKSWAYENYAENLKAGLYLSDEVIKCDPEWTRFQALHAAAIQDDTVRMLDRGSYRISPIIEEARLTTEGE